MITYYARQMPCSFGSKLLVFAATFCLLFSQTQLIALAATTPSTPSCTPGNPGCPLSPDEVKALNDYPNWVAACGSSTGTTTDTTSPGGGVAFDDSQSSDTSNQTTIDDDGIDPSPTGSPDHQSSTSYADGRLGALHTNYIALNPGWALAHGIVLGDVATLTYKGKTVYAVYGDNHVGDTVHSEISVAAAKALGTSGNDSLTGVHTVVYPDTHAQLAGSVDQSKIDQIGAQASGGAPPSTGPTSSDCCPTGSTGSVSGSISPSVGKGMSPAVQQRFQQIMVAAGQKFSVDPNFVATFYYIEDGLAGGDSTNNADSATPPPRTGDGNWKEPPPPYGHGPAYPPPNSATATGPFQFIDTTWTQWGQDGNGDGNKDVNDLTDAAFAASAYLAASGAKNTTSDSNLKRAAHAYNHSDTYAQSALNTFHYLTGKGSTPVSGSATDCSGSTTATGGLTNPFPDGWTPGRLDMGYDGHFTNKIVSPCDGKMVYVNPDSDHGANGGWEGAFFTVLCSQPISDLPSSAFYFAEGVSPTVGQNKTVTAGQQIGVPGWTGYSEGPGGIEWGLADPNDPGNALALRSQAGCSANGAYKSEVLKFSKWAQQNLHLAPPSSTDNAGCA